MVALGNPIILHYFNNISKYQAAGIIEDIKSFWQDVNDDPPTALIILFTLIILTYSYQTLKYLFKSISYKKNSKRKMFIGPIKIAGDIPNAIGSRGFASALRTEFLRINNCLKDMANENPKSYHAPATGVQTGYCCAGLRISAPVPKLDLNERQSLMSQSIEQDITLKLGQVNIPISEISNGIMALIGVLPILFRRYYNNSLIYVSFIEYNENTRLSVHRPKGYIENGIWRTKAFSRTYTTKDFKDINIVIRDAAFMILGIHEEWQYNSWESMRFMLDGFEDFEKYRKTGSLDYCKGARNNFKLAIENNPEDNHVAMYYYGVMTMVDRSESSIESSIGFFKSGLSTDNPKLKAFIHAGLAFCYSQSFHRLGKKDIHMIETAHAHVSKSVECWDWLIPKPKEIDEVASKEGHFENKYSLKRINHSYNILDIFNYNKSDSVFESQDYDEYVEHPLINYTRALVLHADEGSKELHEDRKQRFLLAAILIWKAIQLAKYNSMYVNNLGWITLKLTEWEEISLPKDHPLYMEYKLDSPLISEIMLQKSIALNPNNNLAYANLCLLYSTRYFRERDLNLYFHNAVYYGEKAIKIDPTYINGHRDLTVAHIRYNELEIAMKYFLKSLELADAPYKDQEIIKDIIDELNNTKNLKANVISSSISLWDSMDENEKHRWQSPDKEFLRPH